jgi:hypothetical protein
MALKWMAAFVALLMSGILISTLLDSSKVYAVTQAGAALCAAIGWAIVAAKS